MLDLSRGIVSSLGQQIALHRAICQHIIHRQACIPSGNCSKEELLGMHPGSMLLSEGKLIPGGIKCFVVCSMFSVGVAKSVIVSQSPDLCWGFVTGVSNLRGYRA